MQHVARYGLVIALLAVLAAIRSASAEPCGVTWGRPDVQVANSEPLTLARSYDHRPWQLSADQPFKIVLGRGSGWHGLDTVAITESGAVTVHRRTVISDGENPIRGWEEAELSLPRDLLMKVVDSIEANHLLKLADVYSGSVADGSQWILLVTQGRNRKAVMFSNHFPLEIQRFAQHIDAVLRDCRIGTVTWQRLGRFFSDRARAKVPWDAVKPPATTEQIFETVKPFERWVLPK